jgi:uncharacterized integral membrane protein
MKFVKMFLALVGLAVLFVFVRDNTGKIVVRFWDYATPEIEIFLVLIITFALGMIVASFGSTLKIIKLKRQLKNAGTTTGEPSRENKKDKKSKLKKDDAKKAQADAPSTSSPSSSGAGSVATGAAAAAYSAGATAASTPESSAPGAGASVASAVEEQDEELPESAAAEEDKGSASGAADTQESQSSGETPTDEVISLPADDTKAGDEDRK